MRKGMGRQARTLDELLEEAALHKALEAAVKREWGDTYDAALERLHTTYPLPPRQELLARLAAHGVYLLGRIGSILGTAITPDRDVHDRLLEHALYAARKTYLTFYPLEGRIVPTLAQLPSTQPRRIY